MDELQALARLARALGVRASYVDGLDRPVEASPETLVRVCAALGASITRPADALDALRAHRAERSEAHLSPVLVAWNGRLPAIPIPAGGPAHVDLRLENDGLVSLECPGPAACFGDSLPFGYHRLTLASGSRVETCTVISAPDRAWRRGGTPPVWGVGAHLAALRSARSRSVGDLHDLGTLCRWVGAHGGDLVAVLPLLPTFNAAPAEPSPYAPVSRLFWSELILDLGPGHHPAGPPARLDVTRADAEVRAALRGVPAPDAAGLDAELQRYARFRGAQARLGRDWRSWPAGPRAGLLADDDVDAEEERFHLVAQTLVRGQLGTFRAAIERTGVRLGLDLAVGVHPDGYDPWSRQGLFAEGMSVGAPPDRGFPSGQDWGFSPVLPEASRREGHRYVAASFAHQAELAGVLRVDHIMALTRLYWIPHGFSLHEGTYVSYPADELFAVLTLESHRHRCEVLGENLGTVPPEIREALPRHGIRGTYLAQFAASEPAPAPPTAEDVAFIGSHDTPTLAGWVAGVDIGERVRYGLLEADAEPAERAARASAAARLARAVGASPEDLRHLLGELLEWLGRSSSPLVIPWLEDLWLEVDQVNLPGTLSSRRPNWQRPMSRLLDDVLADLVVAALVRRLDEARASAPPAPELDT